MKASLSMQARVAEQPDAAHRSAQRPADGHHRLPPRPPEPSAAGTPSANAGGAKVLQPVAPPLDQPAPARVGQTGCPAASVRHAGRCATYCSSQDGLTLRWTGFCLAPYAAPDLVSVLLVLRPVCVAAACYVPSSNPNTKQPLDTVAREPQHNRLRAHRPWHCHHAVQA